MVAIRQKARKTTPDKGHRAPRIREGTSVAVNPGNETQAVISSNRLTSLCLCHPYYRAGGGKQDADGFCLKDFQLRPNADRQARRNTGRTHVAWLAASAAVSPGIRGPGAADGHAANPLSRACMGIDCASVRSCWPCHPCRYMCSPSRHGRGGMKGCGKSSDLAGEAAAQGPLGGQSTRWKTSSSPSSSMIVSRGPSSRQVASTVSPSMVR